MGHDLSALRPKSTDILLVPAMGIGDQRKRRGRRLEEGTGREEEEPGRGLVLISSVRVCYNDDPLSLSLPPKYMSTWTTLGH